MSYLMSIVALVMVLLRSSMNCVSVLTTDVLVTTTTELLPSANV